MRTLLGVVLLIFFGRIMAQESVLTQKLRNNSLHFTIDEDSISSPGFSFFNTEFEQNHFVVLGEYHRSPKISELTRCLIPVFHRNGGKRMGLEVGRISGNFLQEAIGGEKDPLAVLRNINTEYKYQDGSFSPIPFFNSVSDALILKEAKKHDIKLFGLDQEFLYGYMFLIDRMFDGLTEEQNKEHAELYSNLKDTIDAYYLSEQEYNNKMPGATRKLIPGFKKSIFIKSSLEVLANTNEENERVVKAIVESVDIYYNNYIRDWWESNRLRTDNFILNLSENINHENSGSKDKTLFKIGGLHAAKGLNGYNMYDVGNAVYEYARLNGKSSLHIVFMSRYEEKEGEVKDDLSDTTSWYAQNFGEIISLGQKEEWTIIDIRPIRKFGLYSEKVNPRIAEYFQRYDVIIIPPADVDQIQNID